MTFIREHWYVLTVLTGVVVYLVLFAIAAWWLGGENTSAGGDG